MTIPLVVGGNLVRQVATLGANLLLAQRCGPVIFGIFGVAQSIWFVAVGVGDWGGRLWSWRAVARAARPEVEADGLFVGRALWMSCAALGLLVFTLFLPELGGVTGLLRWFAPAMVFNLSFGDWYFLSRGRQQEFFVYAVLQGGIYLAGIYFWILNSGDIYVAPLLLAVSAATAWALVRVAMLGRIHWVRANVLIKRYFCDGDIRKERGAYAFYDVLQRGYGSYPTLLMAYLLSRDGLGSFRLTYIGYAGVVSVAAFGASAVYSAVAKRGVKDVLSVARLTGIVVVGAALCGAIVFLGRGLLDKLIHLGWPQYDDVGIMAAGLSWGTVFAGGAALLRELSAADGRARTGGESYLVGLLVGALAALGIGQVSRAAAPMGISFGEMASFLYVAFPYLRTPRRQTS